ncbi:hypothetical protein HOB30_00910, partial [Candidatus Falkowbacteria bacterium]|nr:hypothetical protein [Candidatus Falkowbacteria bacterium]
IFHRVEELPVHAQVISDGEPLRPVDHIPVHVSKVRMEYVKLRDLCPALYFLFNAQIFVSEDFDALIRSSRFALILMAFGIIGKDEKQFVFCGQYYHEKLVSQMREQLEQFMPLLHAYLNDPKVQAQIKLLDRTELS